VLLLLFCVVVDCGHLWLARVELETALEGGALAAAQQWGEEEGGDTFIARELGQAYAGVNRVRGDRVVLDHNYESSVTPGVGLNPNQNATYPRELTEGTAVLIFGVIRGDDTDGNPATPDEIVFDTSDNALEAANRGRRLGVRAQAMVPVRRFNFPFLGTVANHAVQATVTAEHDPASGRTRLIRIDEFIAP
jgi:hypothetical protein